MISFFGRPPYPPSAGHAFQFLQPLDRLLHRGHVGEQSAQPALVDVEHLAAGGFFGDGFLRLALGADEQHVLALRGHFAHIAGGVLEQLQGLLQVDYVDAVAFAKDVFFHLWIPALGLVPEVNAGFEQFFHRYCGQTTSLRLYNPLSMRRRRRGPKRDLRRERNGKRLHTTYGAGHQRPAPHVKKLTAWRTGTVCARPFGRTSCARAERGSRVRRPSFFSRDRSSR